MMSHLRNLAQAIHRIPPNTTAITRSLSSSLPRTAFDGSKLSDHVTKKKDQGNVQHDAAKGGMAERDSGDGSAATSEKDGDSKNKKAQEEFPEAPGVVIGMNDERGGKGR